MIDYAELYDGYWQRPDRIGATSIPEPDKLARTIVTSCGFGRYLDVGSGMGHLVRSLLELGVDAQGVDVSKIAVDSCNSKVPNRFHLGDACKLPFEDNAFDTVVSTDCLEHLAEEDLELCLAELWRVTRKNLYLQIATRMDRDAKWHLTVQGREWWEERLIKKGFRRHPRYFDHNQYHSMGEVTHDIVFLGQKVSDSVKHKYPSDWLLENRDLHMDMGRETGARSDAHLIRYHWARKFIKRGDVVVDAACGLGYGSWMLKSGTEARAVIGLDQSEKAVEYCKAAFNFPDLTFEKTVLPDGLSHLKNPGVNVIVCFETLEHLADPQSFLKACWDILLPGGRVIVSVPHDWSDETGLDPNPHHFHVYDWRSLKEQLQTSFTIDRAIAQTATRSKNNGQWQQDQRRFASFNTEAEQAPISEWLLATAVKDPLVQDSRAYIDHRFPGSISVATDFSTAYDNPWVAQNLVAHHGRAKKISVVVEACEQTILDGSHSVDVGAALCVLGYQLLGNDATVADLLDFKKSIEAWLLKRDDNPHEIRWAISLLFLMGKMAQSEGNLIVAAEYYRRCSEIDPLLYNPTIATKNIEADYRRGVILWSTGNTEEAKAAWLSGIKTADRAVKADWDVAFGDPESFHPYVLDELETCIRMASCCSAAFGAAASPEMSGNKLNALFERLLGTEPSRCQSPSENQTPTDRTHTLGIANTKILAANKWCKELVKKGSIACNLHPTNLLPADQPRWSVELLSNKQTRGIAWSAIAGNLSELNNGAVVVIEAFNATGSSLQTWKFDLKAREKFNHWLDVARIDNLTLLEFMVICNPLAETISCTGVLIEIKTVF